MRSLVDVNQDIFSFSLFLPLDMPAGGRCEFCIEYSVMGVHYWDNNNGNNYVLRCATANCLSDIDVSLIDATIGQELFY